MASLFHRTPLLRSLRGGSLYYSTSRDAPVFPVVAELGPKRLDNLEPGKRVMWCTCGLSRRQPWCDGSHRPTSFKPLSWQVPVSCSTTSYSFCQCKHTGTPPLCDGTHRSLSDEVERRRHGQCCTPSECGVPLTDGKRRFCERCGRVWGVD